MKKYAIAFLATILILLVVWKISDSAEEPENTYNSTVEENQGYRSGLLQGKNIIVSVPEMEESVEAEDVQTEEPLGTEDDTEIDINVSTIESSVSVIMKTEVKPLMDENGITYYTSSSTYPIIAIDGNKSAAEKINADIRSRIEPILSASGSHDAEKSWAKYLYENVPELTDTFFCDDVTYKVTRADDNVISFAITHYWYSGGGHGQFNTIGVNYDTNTGEQISFDDLSKDHEHFRMATLAYNQALAETEAYRNVMFPEENRSLAVGTLEDVLYSDDRWCLSAYGLVFLSNPYALGPFASGLIEFTIPYSDLEDMGFNEAYTYTGRLIVKLLNREIYSVDLNGDGNEETAVYYFDFLSGDEIGNDTDENRVHLIIDDFDFGRNGDDDTRELLADYMNSKLVLYDLDINDDYAELVLLTGGSAGRENTYYSNFFRYTRDGSLVYLGRVKGDVTDLSVSALEFEH